MHVKNILSTPGGRILIVLDSLKIPFGAARHRVYRNPPQETNLSATRITQVHPFHERFQIRGVTFTANFNSDEVAVGVVLETIDRIAYFTEGSMQLSFFLPDNREANGWQCGR